MSTAGMYEPGARWTFVHSNGTQTAYVLDRCMVPASPSPDGKAPGLAGVYALLNPATGKYAEVSQAWPRRKPSQHSHWIYEGPAEMEMAA